MALGTAFSSALLVLDGRILSKTRKGMDEVCNDLTWLSVLLDAEWNRAFLRLTKEIHLDMRPLENDLPSCAPDDCRTAIRFTFGVNRHLPQQIRPSKSRGVVLNSHGHRLPT